jgi:ubiquinone/menaquinone biosynthesis C-methylase UbiE
MTKTQFNNVAEAFARKALVYDDFGRDHIQLSRMRHNVYRHIQSLRQPGDSLLELNAGTGTDALHMVQQGYSVYATDLSDGMIAQIQDKIVKHDVGEQLQVQQLSFTALDQLPDRQFDGVYSNFGGLNCIDDLRLVTRHLPRLLKPQATVTWVIMPRFCPWEVAHFWKDRRVAFRRWNRDGVQSNVEGVQFRTYYFSVGQTMAAFGDRFALEKVEGLSIFSPSGDNYTFAVNHPHLYRWLVAVDDRLCEKRPFNGWGDFFILSMRFLG